MYFYYSFALAVCTYHKKLLSNFDHLNDLVFLRDLAKNVRNIICKCTRKSGTGDMNYFDVVDWLNECIFTDCMKVANDNAEMMLTGKCSTHEVEW